VFGVTAQSTGEAAFGRQGGDDRHGFPASVGAARDSVENSDS
jgi:hypothetical protein